MIDVLIAGAGPAGTTAAIVLARAGARVLLVDRARFPRDKLCGDTLNPGALAVLRRLGVHARVEERGLRIDGMIVTGEGGVRVEGPYPSGQTGRAVRRLDLDAWLLDHAVAAGAEVEEGVRVSAPLVVEERRGWRVRGVLLARRDGRAVRVPAALTVAADGRRSTLGLALGLVGHPRRPRRWAVGGYFEEVDGRSSFGEMHVRRGRYIGVAPLADGLTNACLVTEDRAGFADPSRLLRDALSRDPLLRDRFAAARSVGPAVTIGPLAVDARAAGAPGLLLAGDAAGFIDPMTGDGLRFALRGGELAARAALEALETGAADTHARLARWRAAEFGRKWLFNRALRRLVASPAGVRAGSVGAAVLPAALRSVIAAAGDVTGAAA